MKITTKKEAWIAVKEDGSNLKNVPYEHLTEELWILATTKLREINW